MTSARTRRRPGAAAIADMELLGVVAGRACGKGGAVSRLILGGWPSAPSAPIHLRKRTSAVLAVHDLEIRVGARVLMSDVSFRVSGGDKIGLVGRNGAG